jgi:hypothetical protein
MTDTIDECTVNKLLMMGRGTARNIQSFMPKKIWEISASCWFYCKEICYDVGSQEYKICGVYFPYNTLTEYDAL